MSLLSERDIASLAGTLDELTNVTLTEIATPGGVDAYGDPDPEDINVVWSGSARGFFARERRVETVRGQEVVRAVDTLRLFDSAGAPMSFLADSPAEATTVVVDGTRWTVRSAERDQDGTLDSIRLELDGQTTVTP